MTQIFVYGLLLDPYFRLSTGAELVGPAKLMGYELVFDGFASVLPSPQEHTYGAVLEVTPEMLRRLDRVEGVIGEPRRSNGLYRRSAAVVEILNEKKAVVAEVYVKNKVNIMNPCAPSRDYLNTILRAYQELDLPLAKLEETLSAHSFVEFR